MAGINKTNAARLLDRAKIPYSLIPYEVDENDLAAQHIADQLGEDINCVFKTLVLHGDKNGFLVCVIPGNREVDLKKAAHASGNKKVEMIPMKELLATTGYIRGGYSPVGMKKPFPVTFDASVATLAAVTISAGKAGTQVEISPADLLRIVPYKTAEITK